MKLNDGFLTAISSLLPASQVLTDSVSIALYAQDWSNVLVPHAKAILFPKTTLEVSQILKIATLHHQTIVPSGGRTGLSGGAVATQNEVVLSLEKLNFIGPIHEGSLSLHVGAGAITEAVHDHCKPYGLTWPVDFASKGSSQVGGNIATNAGGVRVLRYGSTRNWVLGLTSVTMDGTVHQFNGELEKNNTGVDFRHLLIGSEGILAVITEATLKLCALPQSRLVFLFALENFSEVVKLFSYARKNILNLSAFECMDEACFQVTTRHLGITPPLKAPTQNGHGTYVLLEIQNENFERAEKWLTEVFENDYVSDGVMAQSEKDVETFWKIREGIAESILHNHEVHQEDVSVPIQKLEAFYSDIHSRYQKEYSEYEIFFFGHIGDGNLHVFIRKPKTMDSSQFIKMAHESDLKLFETLAQYHGSVSAEHGIGLLKKHAIHFSRTPLELQMFMKLKSIFDPQGLLNPGKIIQ